MPTFEVEHNGKVYEVEAASPEEAAAAFDTPAEQPTNKGGQMYGFSPMSPTSFIPPSVSPQDRAAEMKTISRSQSCG